VIGGQIMIVFIGGAAFGTTPISPVYWAISIALGAGGLVIGALARLIPDAPIGQVLIKLGVMPNLDTLPRTRSKRETGETGDEKMYRCEFLHCIVLPDELLQIHCLRALMNNLYDSPQSRSKWAIICEQEFPQPAETSPEQQR
jgi:hypothetical protein